MLKDEIKKLADQLLKLNEEKQQQTLQTRINQIQSRIDYCEQRINEIVYELSRLTKEEIALIEMRELTHKSTHICNPLKPGTKPICKKPALTSVR